MALDDYDWGYCKPCNMLVAVTLLVVDNTKPPRRILDEHKSAINGRCSGSSLKAWVTPRKLDQHNESTCPDCIDMRNHINYERQRSSI